MSIWKEREKKNLNYLQDICSFVSAMNNKVEQWMDSLIQLMHFSLWSLRKEIKKYFTLVLPIIRVNKIYDHERKEL